MAKIWVFCIWRISSIWEIAILAKSPIFRTTKNGYFQDPQMGYLGTTKKGRFLRPEKGRFLGPGNKACF